MTRGQLVVFCGSDGSGKSSQIDLLVPWLEAKLGRDSVIRTKDPGGTKLGMAIRRVMFEEVPTTEMAPGVVDLLFLATHIQNWETVVKPALAAKKVVVSDRWWNCQMAYATQRYVPPSIASVYNSSHGQSADLLVFLHGDVKVMTDRARSRETETHQSTKTWNSYDKLSRIQDAYFRLFDKDPNWCPICVDLLSKEQVQEKVRVAVGILLEKYQVKENGQ